MHENPQHPTQREDADAPVVVVGAGLSGLIAARELHRSDIDVIVLEAAERLGGRALSETTALGSRVDLGGQWIGTLADRLADQLGARIRLGHKVVSITRTETGVLVGTTSGVVRAAKVILTVPPPLLDRISFTPALSGAHAELAHNTYMGSVYKAIAVYERPFWRERRGGELLILDAPARAVFDTTPPGGPGHLCILIGGPQARELDRLDADTRATTVLDAIARHLGPEVSKPVSWHEKSWQLDEYVGGGYTALADPGVTAGLPPVLSTPVGDIHWAGTERAQDHAGYFEGAIESGTRAAREVTRALLPRTRTTETRCATDQAAQQH
ncbi:FAD-dependent oxidoreductase [Nocardia sp. 2]|uniref:FAD-dependent oxidoreductase n=1 Tax=Nocardia acididurans TaxID=2802282 RepID=A0ABS1MDV6_9NOCA|nr:NAD(P)/FAD-dependent oxidoreductase [Nocardia acididurans]MBL1078845.1 FAD-dependent oxidoreductase [Nocardia acididurans]